MEDVLTFQSFFNAFNELQATYRQSELLEEQQSFLDFQKRFQAFDNEMSVLLKAETPYYNIFSVLNISHLEERVHTPFLGHLLNPKANHEQGSLFLNSFLKDVLHLPFTYEQMKDFQIKEELSTEKGRFDITLRFWIDGVPKAIIIENKIYAKDQNKQLQRYYFYLTSDLKLRVENCHLVYLTPHGTRPTNVSIDSFLAKALRHRKILRQIGYRKHIKPWLSNCLPEESNKFKHTLEQYIKTISSL